MKEEVYETGKILENSLEDKLKEFPKPFEEDDVSTHILRVNDSIKIVGPLGVWTETSSLHKEHLESTWVLKDYRNERKLYTLEEYKQTVTQSYAKKFFYSHCKEVGHDTSNCIIRLPCLTCLGLKKRCHLLFHKFLKD